MAIDWTKPLEWDDGTPARLLTGVEVGEGFGGTNPDMDGDYWVTHSRYPSGACVTDDDLCRFGLVLRNVGSA